MKKTCGRIRPCIHHKRGIFPNVDQLNVLEFWQLESQLERVKEDLELGEFGPLCKGQSYRGAHTSTADPSLSASRSSDA